MQQAMVKREDLTTSAPRAAEAWDQERDSLLILLASSPPLPPAAPLLAVRSLDPRFGPPVQMAPRLRHAHVHSCTASCIHHKHSEARTHTDTLAHNLTQTFPHGSHTTYGCTLAHSLVHIDTRTDAFIYAHKHTIADAHANSASVFPNLSTAFIRLHLLCQSACGGPHRQNK